jgi:hypothetical protein
MDCDHRATERPSGWFLLELLRLSGWDVATTVAFGGAKALVLASDARGNDVRVEASTIAEAALVAFKICASRRHGFAGSVAA